MIYSQDNVFKAGFVKVKDIVLGYTIPQKVITKIPVKSLRLTAHVTNPYQWYQNERNVDPENPNYAAWTNLTRYTFGINVTF